jgi:hypothetical protein
MSTQRILATTDRNPYGWRAGASRVLANALLVLLAFEAVSIVIGATGAIVSGGTFAPVTPPEAVLLMAVFLLVRWLYVLPGLVVVLIGIEYVARRAPHARVLTAIVAFTPMVWWELMQSSGAFPSVQGAVLGVTAVVFALDARLPARSPGRSTNGRVASPPIGPAEAAGSE